jgi:hypothetical protein
VGCSVGAVLTVRSSETVPFEEASYEWAMGYGCECGCERTERRAVCAAFFFHDTRLHYTLLETDGTVFGGKLLPPRSTLLCEQRCTVLYCSVLRYTVLYCTALYSTAVYCATLYSTALHCTYCTVRCCTALLRSIPYIALRSPRPSRGPGPARSRGSLHETLCPAATSDARCVSTIDMILVHSTKEKCLNKYAQRKAMEV